MTGPVAGARAPRVPPGRAAPNGTNSSSDETVLWPSLGPHSPLNILNIAPSPQQPRHCNFQTQVAQVPSKQLQSGQMLDQTWAMLGKAWQQFRNRKCR